MRARRGPVGQGWGRGAGGAFRARSARVPRAFRGGIGPATGRLPGILGQVLAGTGGTGGPTAACKKNLAGQAKPRTETENDGP